VSLALATHETRGISVCGTASALVNSGCALEKPLCGESYGEDWSWGMLTG
jgi:hypothetical protein